MADFHTHPTLLLYLKFKHMWKPGDMAGVTDLSARRSGYHCLAVIDPGRSSDLPVSYFGREEKKSCWSISIPTKNSLWCVIKSLCITAIGHFSSIFLDRQNRVRTTFCCCYTFRTICLQNVVAMVEDCYEEQHKAYIYNVYMYKVYNFVS